RNALEELPGGAVDDRVEADSVRGGAEAQPDPVERPDLVQVRLYLRAAVFAREIHQERAVDVSAHDGIAAEAVHGLLERGLTGERSRLRVAGLLVAVDGRLLRGNDLPAAEVLVDDPVRRVRLGGVGLVDHLFELRLVGRPDENDEVQPLFSKSSHAKSISLPSAGLTSFAQS